MPVIILRSQLARCNLPGCLQGSPLEWVEVLATRGRSEPHTRAAQVPGCREVANTLIKAARMTTKHFALLTSLVWRWKIYYVRDTWDEKIATPSFGPSERGACSAPVRSSPQTF